MRKMLLAILLIGIQVCIAGCGAGDIFENKKNADTDRMEESELILEDDRFMEISVFTDLSARGTVRQKTGIFIPGGCAGKLDV